jgi:hypothetical protein
VSATEIATPLDIGDKPAEGARSGSARQIPILHLPRVVEHVVGAVPDHGLDRPGLASVRKRPRSSAPAPIPPTWPTDRRSRSCRYPRAAPRRSISRRRGTHRRGRRNGLLLAPLHHHADPFAHVRHVRPRRSRYATASRSGRRPRSKAAGEELSESRHSVTEMVGGRGHCLNSRIELGSGVLDLVGVHCDRLEPAAADVQPARRCLN